MLFIFYARYRKLGLKQFKVKIWPEEENNHMNLWNRSYSSKVSDELNLAYDLNSAFLASGSFISNKYSSWMKTTFTRRGNFGGCKHPVWQLKTCAQARFHLLDDAGLNKCSIFSNLQGWQTLDPPSHLKNFQEKQRWPFLAFDFSKFIYFSIFL